MTSATEGEGVVVVSTDDGGVLSAERNGSPERNSDARSSSVLLNGLRVLESFSFAEPGLGVSEIAR